MTANIKYKFLTAHFFKATVKGQINSLWKKRHILERIEEYKQALAVGHVKLDVVLNKGQVKRMLLMGIEVPEHLKPIKKEKELKTPKKTRHPNEVRLTNRQVERLKEFGLQVPKEMLPLRIRKIKKISVVESEDNFTVKNDNEH